MSSRSTTTHKTGSTESESESGGPHGPPLFLVGRARVGVYCDFGAVSQKNLSGGHRSGGRISSTVLQLTQIAPFGQSESLWQSSLGSGPAIGIPTECSPTMSL